MCGRATSILFMLAKVHAMASAALRASKSQTDAQSGRAKRVWAVHPTTLARSGLHLPNRLGTHSSQRGLPTTSPAFLTWSANPYTALLVCAKSSSLSRLAAQADADALRL